MVSTERSAYGAVIASPIPGVPRIGLRVRQGGVGAVEFLYESGECFCSAAMAPVAQQLQCYLNEGIMPSYRPRPVGTPFRQRVWQALVRIPPGEARAYGELARELDSAPRAVAAACRANPLPLLIPCHRVVASNGPGGYLGQTAGQAVRIKQWLLRHEGYS